jgi:hypothetical protein
VRFALQLLLLLLLLLVLHILLGGMVHPYGKLTYAVFRHWLRALLTIAELPAAPRIYNCDGQLCPTGSSDAVKEVYRRFNSAAVKLYGHGGK